MIVGIGIIGIVVSVGVIGGIKMWKQINKIKNMIREFIRMEVVPYELTNQETLSFILDNDYKITSAVLNGHRANNGDEFQTTRVKIEKYRKELKIL